MVAALQAHPADALIGETPRRWHATFQRAPHFQELGVETCALVKAESSREQLSSVKTGERDLQPQGC